MNVIFTASSGKKLNFSTIDLGCNKTLIQSGQQIPIVDFDYITPFFEGSLIVKKGDVTYIISEVENQ